MTINTTNSNDAFKQLLNIEVDFAVYGGLPEQRPDTIETEELFRDELWFVVAPERPFSIFFCQRHITLFYQILHHRKIIVACCHC
ncbi:UNVERIFIED_CONTAM: DNA-binding transcriptional LysR family regulator [Paenibacillus sp. PvR008]